MKPYYQTDLGKLYLGDCLEIMPALDQKFDLCLTDPPYNINKDVWDKIPDYQAWMGKVFLECQRLLKDNGSFYWFHNKMPVIARLMVWIEENTDFIFKKFIVWNKYFKETKNRGFYIQHLSIKASRNYETMAEYCLFYTFQDDTGLSKIQGHCVYPFRDYLRKEILRAKGKIIFKEINQVLGTADNGGGVASACLSENKTVPSVITKEHYLKLRAWLNDENGGEYLRNEYEDLRNEYEDLRNEYEDLRYTFNNQRVTGEFRFHLQDWNNSVWNYSAAPKVRHLTPKPEPLIQNILKHSSNPGDLVIDCFGGSCTTAVACENLNRRWVLIEKEEKYCEISAKRIEEVTAQMRF